MPYKHNPGYKHLIDFLERRNKVDYEQAMRLLEYPDRKTKNDTLNRLLRQKTITKTFKKGVTWYELAGPAFYIPKKTDRLFPKASFWLTRASRLVGVLVKMNVQYPGNDPLKLAIADVIQRMILDHKAELRMAQLLLEIVENRPSEAGWDRIYEDLILNEWASEKYRKTDVFHEEIMKELVTIFGGKNNVWDIKTEDWNRILRAASYETENS